MVTVAPRLLRLRRLFPLPPLLLLLLSLPLLVASRRSNLSLIGQSLRPVSFLHPLATCSNNCHLRVLLPLSALRLAVLLRLRILFAVSVKTTLSLVTFWSVKSVVTGFTQIVLVSLALLLLRSLLFVPSVSVTFTVKLPHFART